MEDLTAFDIGSRLQQARLRRGLALCDIAHATKISMPALNAIEHNDFDRLPGGVFRTAYLRSFAAEVGLDGNAVTRAYRAQFEPRALEMQGDRAADDRPFFGALLLLIGVVLSLAGVIAFRPHGAGSTSRAAPSIEEQTRASRLPLPGPADGSDSEKAEELAFTTANIHDRPSPLLLELGATGLCWVSADADGFRVMYRLLRPGERREVQAKETITLRVGDASSVSYSINGMEGRPLGGKGEPVTVQITNENYEDFLATSTAAIRGAGAGA